MSEVSDRVMMRLAEKIADDLFGGLNEEARNLYVTTIAAALSSHGLRAAVEKAEEGAIDDSYSGIRCKQILAALLGEPPTVKGEK